MGPVSFGFDLLQDPPNVCKKVLCIALFSVQHRPAGEVASAFWSTKLLEESLQTQRISRAGDTEGGRAIAYIKFLDKGSTGKLDHMACT